MALTKDTNTQERNGAFLTLPVAAAAAIYAGALVCLNAQGFAVPGTEASGLKCIGRAEERVINTGEAGAVTVTVKRGIFGYLNSEGADEVKLQHIGDTCYIVDDEQVAATDGSAARSAAGTVFDVDGACVWVKI